ncbi:MAG: CARDB domain-containing protein [Pseudomonadota bacterium]
MPPYWGYVFTPGCVANLEDKMLPDYVLYTLQAGITYKNASFTFDFQFAGGVFNDGAVDGDRVDVAFFYSETTDQADYVFESGINYVSSTVSAGANEPLQYDSFDVQFNGTGIYYVGLQVDPGGEVAEYDETNNTSQLYRVDVFSANSARLEKWDYSWRFGWHLDWNYGWHDGWHYDWYFGWAYGWVNGWYLSDMGWTVGWHQGWGEMWALGWSTGWYLGWGYGWTLGIFKGWGWSQEDSAITLTIPGGF